MDPADPKATADAPANTLPFATAAISVLREAGYTVDDAAAPGTTGLTVEVKPNVDATGTNFAMFPNEDYRWTQAQVKGTIVVTSRGVTVATGDFAGVAQVDLIVLSPEDRRFSSPSDAPYREAYDNSNFAEVLTNVIDKLNGTKPNSTDEQPSAGLLQWLLPRQPLKHFSDGAFRFDYPAEWQNSGASETDEVRRNSELSARGIFKRSGEPEGSDPLVKQVFGLQSPRGTVRCVGIVIRLPLREKIDVDLLYLKTEDALNFSLSHGYTKEIVVHRKDQISGVPVIREETIETNGERRSLILFCSHGLLGSLSFTIKTADGDADYKAVRSVIGSLHLQEFPLVTLQAAHSQQEKESQTTPAELRAAVCKIDAANKTIRVLPWDGQAKTWKRDSLRNLAWSEQTQLMSGGTVLTMPQFLGGKPLSENNKDATGMQGNRAVFYIKIIDGKEVVQRMQMMALFDGESFPAMVGSGGAFIVGGTKVSCGAGN